MSQLKIGTGPQFDKERVKERWVDRFENGLNHDVVTGNDLEKNGKIC